MRPQRFISDSTLIARIRARLARGSTPAVEALVWGSVLLLPFVLLVFLLPLAPFFLPGIALMCQQ
ncbi:hypothetical protein [Paraburkholderia acidiphila]|uniref:Uncharacterized protein n=1 Tax=Paraburkholderia acidiphila TaxID=2571747 RepID=A0A7Z2GAW9_9BURK|nr:hypothetical protein [Paraburkholderia acidiphila]QGZ58214.1 hypothetical protein FAZ97_24750 [Paraburkholderia acidiphila]